MTVSGPVFELLTRERCHLCEDMRAVLDQVLPAAGCGYAVVDVDAVPALRERFGDTVPVLLRDGRPVAKVRIDKKQLQRIVRRRR
ncbi:MAG: glutaredoxin family protein [Acidobacteriota bacterium]|nr:glutaredoxin family protein [Acidobacteriota bacterium]